MAKAPHFWGVEVKSGECLKVYPGRRMIIHLSEVCLGVIKEGKQNESVCVYVSVGDKKLVLGNLSTEKIHQLSTNVVFGEEFKLSHNWASGSVYFIGYKIEDPFVKGFPDYDDPNSDFLEDLLPNDGDMLVGENIEGTESKSASGVVMQTGMAAAAEKSYVEDDNVGSGDVSMLNMAEGERDGMIQVGVNGTEKLRKSLKEVKEELDQAYQRVWELEGSLQKVQAELNAARVPEAKVEENKAKAQDAGAAYKAPEAAALAEGGRQFRELVEFEVEIHRCICHHFGSEEFQNAQMKKCIDTWSDGYNFVLEQCVKKFNLSGPSLERLDPIEAFHRAVQEWEKEDDAQHAGELKGAEKERDDAIQVGLDGAEKLRKSLIEVEVELAQAYKDYTSWREACKKAELSSFKLAWLRLKRKLPKNPKIETVD